MMGGGVTEQCRCYSEKRGLSTVTFKYYKHTSWLKKRSHTNMSACTQYNCSSNILRHTNTHLKHITPSCILFMQRGAVTCTQCLCSVVDDGS